MRFICYIHYLKLLTQPCFQRTSLPGHVLNKLSLKKSYGEHQTRPWAYPHTSLRAVSGVPSGQRIHPWSMQRSSRRPGHCDIPWACVYCQANMESGKLTCVETHAQVIPRMNQTSQFTLTQTWQGHPGPSSKPDWSAWFSLIHSYPRASPTVTVS